MMKTNIRWLWLAGATAVTLIALTWGVQELVKRSDAILSERHALGSSAVVAVLGPGSISRGARLVATSNCVGCHGADLTGGPLGVPEPRCSRRTLPSKPAR